MCAQLRPVFVCLVLIFLSGCSAIIWDIPKTGLPSTTSASDTLQEWQSNLPAAFSSPQTLRPSNASEVHQASNSAGYSIIVWSQSDGFYTNIYKAEKISGTWTYPSSIADTISLAGTNAAMPNASVNASGDCIVTWKQNFNIFKSERVSSTWTHPSLYSDAISPTGTSATVPQVAINASGDAVITWYGLDGSGDNQIYKSEKVSGVWTHPANANDNISPDAQSGLYPRVALNDAGAVIIVWRENDGFRNQIFKSERNAGVWTHPANLADNISPDLQAATEHRVAINNSGDALIVWRQHDGFATQIYKSERTTGVWTHPANLADNISPDLQNAYTPDVAMNTAGDAIISWDQYDGAAFQIFKSERVTGVWTHPASLADNISPDLTYAGMSNVSINAVGNAAIVWHQFTNGFSEQKIFVSTKTAGVWTHPANINDNISPGISNAYYPRVTISTSGDVLISWYEYDANSIYQVFKSERISGAWTHPASVADDISPGGFFTFDLQVAVNASGDAVVVWWQHNGSNNHIFKSERTSGIWTHPTSLADFFSYAGQDASEPQVALNSSGDALVVWQQFNGPNRQIFKKERISGTWSTLASINDNISPDAADASSARIALNDDGDAFVVWVQHDLANDLQIFVSLKEAGVWTHPANRNDNQSVDLTNGFGPQVAMNESGDAIIAWSQADGSGDYQIFKLERVSGAWIAPAGLADNISPDAQDAFQPQVDINSSGDALIAWKQYDGTDEMIYKSEKIAGVWTHPAALGSFISPSGQDASVPRAVLNDDGDALIVWQQSDGSNRQIFKSEKNIGVWTYPSGLSDNISPDGVDGNDPQVVLAESGDAMIVWVNIYRNLFALTRSSGSWGSTETIGNTNSALEFDFAADDDLNPLVIFSTQSTDQVGSEIPFGQVFKD